jgi:hypothetical protein
MSSGTLAQLRELARQDEALRMALDAATTASELRAIALQHNLELSDAELQPWLESRAGQGDSLPEEVLETLSRGLSATDEAAESNALSDDALAAISGGGMAGEALMVGEAI